LLGFRVEIFAFVNCTPSGIPHACPLVTNCIRNGNIPCLPHFAQVAFQQTRFNENSFGYQAIDRNRGAFETTLDATSTRVGVDTLDREFRLVPRIIMIIDKLEL